MQVTEIESKGLRREYKIVIPSAIVEQQVSDRIAAMSHNVKMPGFRPGKVPANMVKQRYGDQAFGETVERLVSDSSQKLVAEKNFRLAVQPRIKEITSAPGKDLEFAVALELFPEIPELDATKITIEKPVFEVGEKDVDEGIERLAKRRATTQKVEENRAAKAGDVVVIDFLGKVGGEAFDGGKAEKFSLELGSGQFIPGFEEQVEGLKQGEERVIGVTFPAEYHSENLAGKPATFDVKLHEIHERKPVKIDDDFAKSLGFQSLDELKAKVREQIERDYNGLVRTRLKKLLFDELESQLKLELPQTMVDQEFGLIWQKVQQAKQMGEEEVKDKTEAELEKEYRKVAERRVKLGLFLAEISGKNKITVSQDELRNAVMEQARMFPGQEQKVVDFYRKNPNHVQELQGPLLEEKAVDFILAQVKYKEQKISLEELLSIDAGGEMGEKKPAKAKKTTKTKKSEDAAE